MRGDCNGDRSIDISDAIRNLFYLYGGEPEVGCLEACDTNRDGANDVSDTIFILSYLFTDGQAPPAPFPACGVLTGEGSHLGCDRATCQ